MTMRRVSTLAGAAALVALLLAAAGSPRGIKEGGAFKVAIASVLAPTSIDPALSDSPYLSRPTCGTLMAYPDVPPPAGLRLTPELAEADPVVSKDGKRYTFIVRKDARFSDGAPVTARAFARAIERNLDPELGASSDLASTVVGGEDVLAGKATSPTGVTANGRRLIIQLTKERSRFAADTSELCAVPPDLPADPEGAKAPLPSAAPYYVSQYVPGERLVLERNRFYNGSRPHHLDRIVATLNATEGTIVDEIATGSIDWGLETNGVWAERTDELRRRYGVNKTRFFVNPVAFTRMFVLNTSRPLFKNNRQLRQAINFAVDRKALTDELGQGLGTRTDHILLLGPSNTGIYPLAGPDLEKARALAKGHLRSHKAVLYTRDSQLDIAQAQILQRNLKAIGIRLEIQTFPGSLIFEKLAEGRNQFDIGRIGWGTIIGPVDPSLLGIFDGRTLSDPDNSNWSYFNSSAYNRLLDRASRLTGAARNQAYADLDVEISRDAAPAIPYAFQNAVTFVSARAGCIVRNPIIDLTAACLK